MRMGYDQGMHQSDCMPSHWNDYSIFINFDLRQNKENIDDRHVWFLLSDCGEMNGLPCSSKIEQRLIIASSFPERRLQKIHFRFKYRYDKISLYYNIWNVALVNLPVALCWNTVTRLRQQALLLSPSIPKRSHYQLALLWGHLQLGNAMGYPICHKQSYMVTLSICNLFR